jgi:hypothetical protein
MTVDPGFAASNIWRQWNQRSPRPAPNSTAAVWKSSSRWTAASTLRRIRTPRAPLREAAAAGVEQN